MKTKNLWQRIQWCIWTDSGETYIDTGVKMLLAIVIGALLLTGIYGIFSDIILQNVSATIQGFFDQTPTLNGGSGNGGSGNGGSGDGGDSSPVMNEYGFYCNVPYMGEVVFDEEYVEKDGFIFYEDGTFEFFSDTYSFTTELLCGSGKEPYEIDENTGCVVDMNNWEMSFSDDGREFTYNTNGDVPELETVTFVANGTAGLVHYAEKYISKEGYSIVFDGNEARYVNSIGITEFSDISWNGHYGSTELGYYIYDLFVSIDGERVYMIEYDRDWNETVTIFVRNGVSENGIDIEPCTVGVATFDRYITNVGCCEQGYHEDGCFTMLSEPVTLTWDELQLEENAARYGYVSNGVSDTSIEYKAFSECLALISINVPEGVTYLGGEALSGDNIVSITLPSTLENLGGASVFQCGDALESIIFNGTLEEWHNVYKSTYWQMGLFLTLDYIQCSDGRADF